MSLRQRLDIVADWIKAICDFIKKVSVDLRETLTSLLESAASLCDFIKKIAVDLLEVAAFLFIVHRIWTDL